ncbi:ABC transporter substrate-binding protein [Noviherbaspirillum massiliense]|uniref:ABC transporter substrate-binding protein n=1 Tax=Noviherbaspirillum massiliense TaxID=1465823 RepID=UPI0002F18F0E|nr:ABC transporter substrate-binding protein [Noviherbaspirillum massiliense]
MKMKKQLKQLSLAMAVGLAFAGSALAQEVVKIGYSGPLSGGAAQYGKNVLMGMEMAANEINAKGLEVGGKKYKVEIVPLDDKYNPSETAINVQRLVQQHKAPVVLVPHSGGIFAVQAFNEKTDTLLLGYSSLPTLTARGNKLTVRIPPDITIYQEPFSKYEMGRFGKKAGLAPADHDYAKAWTTMFKATWEKSGGEIVSENPMSYNKSTDFYSGVSRVVQGKPDVMFIGGASEPTALVAKQARDLGFKGGFVVMDQAKLDEMAKVVGGYGPLEGSIGVMPLTEDTDPNVQAFVERFKKANTDKVPTTEISLNYSAVHATAIAMKLAGTVTDAKAIRANMDKAIKSLPKENNPNSLEGLDDKGGTLANVTVAAVENGKIKAINLRTLNGSK